MTKYHTCRNCKWFDGGSCHRFPPQMVPWPDDYIKPGVYNASPVFPYVTADNWCGEWGQKP